MAIGLAIARFAHFASLLSLLGALFYVGALAPVGLGAAMAPGLRKIAPALAGIALASALAWAALVASDMAGGPLDAAIFASTLDATAFGAVWRVRLALLALLAVLTIVPGPRWRAPLVVAGAAAASLALVGHAATQTGALGFAHRLDEALHLLLVAYWLGGLPPFFVSLRGLARDPSQREALVGMMRFSRFGHFAVPGLFLTGLIDLALTTHRLPLPPLSGYLIGLAAKTGIFAAMTGLALLNRYFFAPYVLRRNDAANALAAGTLAEFALGLAALALVSEFAMLNPN